MSRRVLIVSPAVSHGFGQGNSARIVAIADCLTRAGAVLHYFHIKTEGPNTRLSERAMREYWDFYMDVDWWPKSMALGLAPPFALDDWIDENNVEAFKELITAYDFDAVLVNYVWMSKFLEVCRDYKPDAIRVLDLHDRFGDRNVELLRMGLAPAWYYTTQAEEARGLARADVRIAIQGEEAAYFTRISGLRSTLVRHAPVAERATASDARSSESNRLRVGYLASNNILNRFAIQQLLSALDASGGYNTIELVLAGPISVGSEFSRVYTRSLGFVGSVADFYRQVDVVVNPMTGGTGLKIKTVESLAYGVPVISTVDGSRGMEIDHPDLNHRSAGSIATRLLELAENDMLFQEVREQILSEYDTYGSRVREEEKVLVRLVFGE